MSSVYDAVGGIEGLLRLANEWHVRVMADEVVSHAFSHGYHSDHTERLAAMSRYHRPADDVPEGLGIPKWSWNGLILGTDCEDV